MAVLLIGSTGNGKSTLGNFLFDPKYKNKEHFEVGKDNLPKTQTCKAITQTVEYQQGQENNNDTSHGISEDSSGAQSSTSHLSNVNGVTSSYTPATGSLKDTRKFSKASFNEEVEMTGSLTIIDTPGLNENNGNDFEHMNDLITALKEQKIFKACILVAKYSANIDQQYRDTIKYYATLLPDLFSHNCFIVLTHHATDSHTVKVRKHQGYDHDIIIENIKKEIIESSGICFTPIVFSIDCVPGANEEIEHKRVRDTILSHIFSLSVVDMTKFHVAKTKIMMGKDREEICLHRGKIEGYYERLKEMNENAAEALDELKIKEERITTIKVNLTKQEESLKDKDSDDLVIAHVWSVSKRWKFFKKQKKTFDETSKFEVSSTQLWTNGHCGWKEYTQEGKRVHGVVKGKFMRGLYASITMGTKKKVKFAEDIAELKEVIESLRSKLRNAEDAEEECRKKHGQFESEMSFLKKYTEENRKKIEYFSHDKMILEEAKA